MDIANYIERPKFREIRCTEKEIPENYDYMEPKMDGIWGCLVVEKGYWRVYSRTGKIKAAGECVKHWKDIHDETWVVLGEYMHGSAWGHRMDIDKHFFAFDCLMWDNSDIRSCTQNLRWNMLKHFRKDIISKEDLPFNQVRRFKVYDDRRGPVGEPNWDILWKQLVENQGYEGLIFKDSNARYKDKGAWMRMKAEVEIDYICSGMAPADPNSKYAGQVGAVIGTLYDRECDVKCGGLTEKQREVFTKREVGCKGQVFTAKGNGWYPSGAIRHPKFVRWRPDKSASECVYAQIPREIRDDEEEEN